MENAARWVRGEGEGRGGGILDWLKYIDIHTGTGYTFSSRLMAQTCYNKLGIHSRTAALYSIILLVCHF